MAAVTASSEKLGLCEGCYDRLKTVLQKYNLPVLCPYDAQSLFSAALSDKKREGDDITLVVPKKIGECVLNTIPVSGMKDFIRAGLDIQ